MGLKKAKHPIATRKKPVIRAYLTACLGPLWGDRELSEEGIFYYFKEHSLTAEIHWVRQEGSARTDKSLPGLQSPPSSRRVPSVLSLASKLTWIAEFVHKSVHDLPFLASLGLENHRAEFRGHPKAKNGIDENTNYLQMHESDEKSPENCIKRFEIGGF